MAETTETPLWHENEPAKVESWRLHILLEAGYPVPLAERIAVSEVDLHDAVQLLTRGCDPVDRDRDPALAAARAVEGGIARTREGSLQLRRA